MNLLIVDDHAGMRAMIRDLLSEFATQIRECATAEEALSVCRHYVPDCVTMDLRMGAMSGLECTRRIRELHPTTNIAVVTQFKHDTLRTYSQAVGADTFIGKDDLYALKRYVEILANRLNS